MHSYHFPPRGACRWHLSSPNHQLLAIGAAEKTGLPSLTQSHPQGRSFTPGIAGQGYWPWNTHLSLLIRWGSSGSPPSTSGGVSWEDQGLPSFPRAPLIEQGVVLGKAGHYPSPPHPCHCIYTKIHGDRSKKQRAPQKSLRGLTYLGTKSGEIHA